MVETSCATKTGTPFRVAAATVVSANARDAGERHQFATFYGERRLHLEDVYRSGDETNSTMVRCLAHGVYVGQQVDDT